MVKGETGGSSVWEDSSHGNQQSDYHHIHICHCEHCVVYIVVLKIPTKIIAIQLWYVECRSLLHKLASEGEEVA